MNILVVGNGGREHALAWKLSLSPRAERVFVAPGNAGTARDAENVDISATDIPRLVSFAKQNDIQLTVVGPEAPLAAGIVDAFETEKLRVFGPSKSDALGDGNVDHLQLDAFVGGSLPLADELVEVTRIETGVHMGHTVAGQKFQFQFRCAYALYSNVHVRFLLRWWRGQISA